MKTFLVHGMGRSPVSLLLLRARLGRAGFAPSLFGYSVALETWEGIVGRFVERVAAEVPPGEAYAIVGHSLGNLIARAASPRLPAGLARLVMLAPPNRPPKLAERFSPSPVVRLFTGGMAARLADPAFFADLPVPPVPTLVYAGTAGPRSRWLHESEAWDGVVAVSETRLEGAEHREVPCLHTFIMNDAAVARGAIAFLASARAPADETRSY